MNVQKKYFNDCTIQRDAFSMLADKKLGSGAFRDVYRHATDPNYVVKFETGAHTFCNILEWEVWDRVQYTNVAKWFAPCTNISPCGTILIQAYCEDVRIDDLPKKVPAFFTDLQVSNWGRYEGRIVCRDYGHTLLLEKGMTRKLQKVRWQES